MATYCFIKQVLAMMAAQHLMLMICAIAVFMQSMRQHDLYRCWTDAGTAWTRSSMTCKLRHGHLCWHCISCRYSASQAEST